MPIQSLTREQLRSLLEAAKRASERDWLMILVGFWHGLRASEVCGIKRDDIRDGFLTVRRLKGSAKTTQELFAHADPLLDERQALIDFARKQARNQTIFQIKKRRFRQLFVEYAKQAKIPAHLRHPHVLKHSIAMQTIHTAGVENVRVHLGHKSLSSTGAYLKISDEDAQRAVQEAMKV